MARRGRHALVAFLLPTLDPVHRVMAGLFIKELLIRGNLRRCLTHLPALPITLRGPHESRMRSASDSLKVGERQHMRSAQRRWLW